MKRILPTLMTTAVLIVGTGGLQPVLIAADAPSDTVSKLFADAKAESSQLSMDWKSSSKQSSLNWKSDGPEIARMKDDVNAATKTIAALNDARGQASPSQLASMERIVPVLQEIADNTTKAIEFLSGNQSRLSGKAYKEYLDASSDTSTRLAGLIAGLVEYDSHRAKFEAAKQMLLAAK